MNTNYRLVWNQAKQVWQAVAEMARSHSKSGRSRAVTTVACLLVSVSGHGGILPDGGTVTAGAGTLSQTGNTLLIHQTTDKLAIDWQGFSIGRDSSVIFEQPSTSSVALNNVLGSDVSLIQGVLKSNGQIFLVNPNGVLFSPTAQVNVGGLVASTLRISTDDFLAGHYRFAGASGNAVINEGNITASSGGSIALIAAHVVNSGLLEATGGSVLAAGGSQVVLDLGGPVKIQVEQAALDALVSNGGAIRADGGLVLLTARAAGDLVRDVINNDGLIQARTLVTGQQGEILLLGDMTNGRIAVGGTLDASAPDGGNGGHIETSAAAVETLADLKVTAGSAQGQGGSWLVDPYNYVINATAADNIASALNTGTSVTITTQSANAAYGGGASGTGDITVSSAIAKQSGGDATLTLRADHSILLNSDISASSGRLNVTLSAANAVAATSGGVSINGNIQSNGGRVLIGGGSGNSVNGIGSALNLDASNAAVVLQAGKSVLSGGGDITINGKSLVGSSSGNYEGTRGGIYIKSGVTVLSGNGNLYMTGESAAGTKTFGLSVDSAASQAILIGSSGTGGHSVINGVNSTPGGTALALDQGAIGLVNYGSRDIVTFRGPSVADWLLRINGNTQSLTYTYNGSSACGSIYPNCGVLTVPGANNSYMYAGYEVVNMATQALYVMTGNGSKVYDGSTVASGVALTSSGGPSGFNLTSLGTLAFATSSKNADSYSILSPEVSNPTTYTSGGSSYAVGYYNNGIYNITQKTLTPIGTSKVYDGTSNASLGATGVVTGDNVSFAYTSGAFASKDVGQWAVTASGISLTGADSGNYTLGGTSVSTTASITPRGLTLSGVKTYDGGTDMSTAVTLGNLVAGESLGYSAATSSDAHVATENKFLSGITLQDGSNGLVSNYALPSLMAAGEANSVTINPRQLSTSLTNTGVNKIYDGSDAAPDGFAPTFSLEGLLAGDAVGIQYGTALYNSKNVNAANQITLGDLAIGTVSGTALSGDYVLDAVTRSVAATITPKALTAVYQANDKVYDGNTTAVVSGSSTDVVGQDEVVLNQTSATFTTKQAGTGKTVTVAGISLSGDDADNYRLDNASATTQAAITPKTLTAVYQANDKVYDGNTTAVVSGSSTDVLGKDDVVLNQTSATFNTKQAGNGKTVTVAGISLSGDDADNYRLEQASATTQAAITPKALTAVYQANDKVYDGNTTAVVSGSSTDVLGQDDVVLNQTSATFNTKQAGTGKTVTVAGISLSGNDANNYRLESPIATTLATIIAAPVAPVPAKVNETLAVLQTASMGQPQIVQPTANNMVYVASAAPSGSAGDHASGEKTDAVVTSAVADSARNIKTMNVFVVSGGIRTSDAAAGSIDDGATLSSSPSIPDQPANNRKRHAGDF